MLTKACEYLEIPVTVFGYSTRGRLLSTPDTEVPELIRIPYVGGGTDPREALEGARRVFEVSNARHKLLFSITDGDWFHEDENHKKVDEVNLVDGVRSMLLYFYEHGSWERRSAEEAIAEKRAALAASNYHHHNRGFIGSVADSINVIADEMADALLDEVIR